jgi:hypothetical protein
VEEGESSTELLEYSLTANNSLDHQVCMASLRHAEDDELDPEYDNKQLADISTDEPTADAPQNEDEEHHRIQRVKNAERAQRRRNTKNGARDLMYQRDLNNTFAAVADREYRTPIGAIAEAALLAQQLPPNSKIQRLQYLSQRALVQLDGQHPVSSTQNLPSRSERHGETAPISRTHRGGLANRRNDSRQCNEGHLSARGNDEQEVQQSTRQPRNQLGARPQGQAPLEASLHDAPTIDLRKKINDSHDARRIIKARRRDCTGRCHNDNNSDRFPPSPPTSPTSPIQRSSNQSESPSTTVSRTRASGFDATPLLLKF